MVSACRRLDPPFAGLNLYDINVVKSDCKHDAGIKDVLIVKLIVYTKIFLNATFSAFFVLWKFIPIFRKRL